MKPQIRLEHNLVKINGEAFSVEQKTIDMLIKIKEPCDIAFLDEDNEFHSGLTMRTLYNVRLTGLEVVLAQIRAYEYDVFSPQKKGR